MRTPSRTLLTALLVLALALSLMPAGVSAGPNESIGVSGHWVIEVRDPDGALVTRRELHNALDNPLSIPRILLRQRTSGPLIILFDSVGGGPRPCTGGCVITESISALAATSRNLVPGLTAEGLDLRGSVTVGFDSTIGLVSTAMAQCLANVATGSCTGSAALPPLPLTRSLLAPGIQVLAGQQVLVTVRIAFATITPPATPQSAAPSR